MHPAAVVREAKKPTLTLRHVNRAGEEVYASDAQVIGLDNDFAGLPATRPPGHPATQ